MSLAGHQLWILLALVMTSRPEYQPVQSDHLQPQWSGQPAAKHLVAGVGNMHREERCGAL